MRPINQTSKALRALANALVENETRMPEESHKQRIVNLARQAIADNWLILDTETTGLDEDDEIVEIAIVDAAGTLEFSSLVSPSKSIPQETTNIHGITNEMVKDALAAPKLWSIIRQMIIGRPLLAYNSAFDQRMTDQTFGFGAFDNHWDCLMNAWMVFHDLERRQRLENVCYQIGVPVGGHRALGDAKAAREVLRWLARQEA